MAGYVQSKAIYVGSSTTSQALTLTGAVTTGNLLVVDCIWENQAATCTISDGHNTWHAIGSPLLGTALRNLKTWAMQKFYAVGATSGTYAVTATFSATVTQLIMGLTEANGPTSFDTYAYANATGTTTVTSPSITPAANGAYIHAACNTDGAGVSSVNAPFTERENANFASNSLDDYLQPTAGAISATWPLTGTNADQTITIAAFSTANPNASVTPSAVACTTTVLAPTVTTAAATVVTPAAVGAVGTVPAVTLSAGVTLSPPAVARTVTVPHPILGVTSVAVSVQMYHPPDPPFPAALAGGGRYFIDAGSVPWLMVGDTAFGLVAILTTTSDVDQYLTTRAAQGFNAVYTNYLYGFYDYHSGQGPAPFADANWKAADGTPPFLKTNGTPGTGVGDYDISQPNPAYLAKLDYIVTKAAGLGIFVVINPFDTALDQSDNPNWLSGQGTARCTAYGTALGTRYRNNKNVGWQWGNDYGGNTSNWNLDTNLGAISTAIRAAAPTQIQSIELNYNTSAGYDNSNWGPGRTYPLNWCAVYDYTIAYDRILKAYNGQSSGGGALGLPTTPVFFVEGTYEDGIYNPTDASSAWECRMIAYYTVVCGGVGGWYGNGIVFPFASGWQSALTHPGAIQMGYLGQVFRAGPWQSLVPAGNTTSFVTSQSSGTYSSSTSAGLSSQSWAAGAVSPLGDFGVVYTPVAQSFTVDMSKMNHSGTVVARWWDPTTAAYSSAGSWPSAGTHAFTTPGTHAAPDSHADWLLVLTA